MSRDVMWWDAVERKHTLGSLSKLCRTRIMNSASLLLALGSSLIGVAGAMTVDLGDISRKGMQVRVVE